MSNHRQHIKKQRHHFADNSLYSQSYDFSSGHVWMWQLDHKESWAPKNWCFRTVLLEKTLESPLESKEIKPINPEGNVSWIIHCKDWWWSWSFNTLANWWKSWLIGKKKTLMLGKIEGRRRRGQQRMRLLDGIPDSMDMSMSKLWEMVKDRKGWCVASMGSQRVVHDWVTEWQI